MLYNITGRTGVNMSPDTVLRLSNHKNVAAIKEASGILTRRHTALPAAGETYVLRATTSRYFIVVGGWDSPVAAHLVAKISGVAQTVFMAVRFQK